MLLVLSYNGTTTHHYQSQNFCGSHPSCTASNQRSSTSLHRTQLPHQSSNNSSLSRHRGLHNSNFGTLEKLSISPLHQAEPLSSGEFILHHGTVPYLTVISIYLYVPIIIMLCLHIPINLQPHCNSLLVWV